MSLSRPKCRNDTGSGLVSERLRHDSLSICGYFIPMLHPESLNSNAPSAIIGELVTDLWRGMFDVGSKPVVAREPEATGVLIISPEAIDAVSNGQSPKGDVRGASTIAAIQAVKETSRTLPHCHPIPIEGCSVNWKIEERGLRCSVLVRTHWITGVEMEALNGVSAGLLCAWDMLKPIEKDDFGQYPNARIDDIRVVRKKKSDPQD